MTFSPVTETFLRFTSRCYHQPRSYPRTGAVIRWGIACLALASVSVRSAVEIIPTAGRNIYRLAVAELDGRSAAKEMLGATYDERVCAFAADGRHLWDAPVGAFVFDLAAGDLDGDGRDESVAAGADGSVFVFDAAGKLRWKRSLGAPVYQVCIAKLDGKTPAIVAGGISRQVVAFAADGTKIASADLDGIVRVMRAGDYDGDGRDEVAALSIRGQQQDVHFFKGPTLARMKETISRGKVSGDPLFSLRPANGLAGDLDGDGADEFIFTPGVHALKGTPRRLFALPEKFATKSYATHYTMRLFAPGNLTGGPGAELAIVEGPELRLYDAAGKLLGKAAAPLGFTDVAYLPGSPHGSVILGSSPNGDDNLYRVTFEPGWEKAFEQIERRGLMARIGADLKQMGDAAARWKGAPMRGAGGPFDVVVNHFLWSGWSPRKFDTWIAEVRDYERLFPYPRLRFATAFWPGEKSPLLRPDGKPWDRDRRLAHDLTREQIVAAAKHFEAQHCHFWVQVGHGCSPHLEVATVAAMLDAAPTTLRGFISAEDEQADVMTYYFEHHLKPILELSLKHGKKVILRNKNIWWARWPADPTLRELVFNDRYRSVILPAVEDSNSRSPDLHLAARVGLWLDGQVDDWVSRCSADWFSFNRSWEWEYPMTGHPQLRYYVSQAMLGARVFMLLNGERERATGNWTRVGAEGTATFLHLLGRGAITPPRREQLRSLSPVALAMRTPTARFGDHGGNGHNDAGWNRDETDTKPWAFDRLDAYWGMAPLPATDVSTYLWGRTRRDASHLPTTTPHGLVAVVPGGPTQPDGRWRTVWTTDGDTLQKGGKHFPLSEARTEMLRDLAEAETSLPFHVEGKAFHHVVEQSAEHFVIALVDPGWLDPAPRNVQLSTRLPGTWNVTDRLTGKSLGTLATPLELSVPAGVLRILEVTRP